MTTADLDIGRAGLGSIAKVIVLTGRGWRWVNRNLSFEPWQRQDDTIFIEPRMIADIARAAVQAGLVVR